jgi:large subunit ribosomal protein L25
MAQTANLQASVRSATGKGAARSLRRQGKVPGVIYGHDRQAEALAVDTTALHKLLIGISAATTIVDVAIEGRPAVRALIREIQRDPLRPSDIIHLDLYEIRGDEAITLEVPVRLIGIPDGVRNFGGELEIEVLPADIPEHIDLDVTALTIGHSLFVRDIRLEKGTILNDPDTPICSVVAPRTEEAPAAPEETAASSEPELIRKPKAEAEGESETKA